MHASLRRMLSIPVQVRFHVRRPGFKRKNPQCNDVQARNDGQQAPDWVMTGATEDLNYWDEKENKRGAQDGEGKKGEKRPNVPPGRGLHTLLRSSGYWATHPPRAPATDTSALSSFPKSTCSRTPSVRLTTAFTTPSMTLPADELAVTRSPGLYWRSGFWLGTVEMYACWGHIVY